MKKYSSVSFHRVLLWGVLLFGATLLLANAWMVINTETDFLLNAYFPNR